MLKTDCPTKVGAPLRIYIAGPLSGKDGMADALNVERADAVAQELYLRGHWPFCPHTQSASWFGRKEPEFHSYTYVVEGLDFGWMSVCDAIYLMPGWEKSTGACMERAFADKHGMWAFNSMALVPKLVQSNELRWCVFQRDKMNERCRRRLILGAEKYGPIDPLRDHLEMACEELEDAENYPFLEYCRLRKLQEKPWPPKVDGVRERGRPSTIATLEGMGAHGVAAEWLPEPGEEDEPEEMHCPIPTDEEVAELDTRRSEGDDE